MSTYAPARMLDKALVLAELELDHLRQGRVDEAREAAGERAQLASQAWESHAALRADGQDPAGSLDELQEKLAQLQGLQGRLTGEAKRLHASLKEELLRFRKEGVRLGAYGKAVRTPDGIPRFVSKRG